MFNHKCYSNPHVLMMRSKASKDSSRGFQESSEISFLISAQNALPTSGQTLMRHTNFFSVRELNGLLVSHGKNPTVKYYVHVHAACASYSEKKEEKKASQTYCHTDVKDTSTRT